MLPPKSSKLLPKRSKRYGVGKEIGGNVYVHRDYETLLGPEIMMARSYLPPDFGYTVVKLNLKTRALTFSVSPDFNTAAEPVVGKQLLVRGDGSTHMREPPADPYIYHHKWLFVAKDYDGFDVEASVRRSIAWMSLSDVDKSLIGRASYWNEHVVPRLSTSTDGQWLRSDEIRRRLKLTTCELAHLCETGKINFQKQGNAYLYRVPTSE